MRSDQTDFNCILVLVEFTQTLISYHKVNFTITAIAMLFHTIWSIIYEKSIYYETFE